MAKLNLEYYSGDNRYSDGDIENEILKIAQEGQTLKELGTVEFPILYHMSKVRENILNWYPFREGAVCLEIGSGCGAISGLLCEKAKRVVSVELSKRRADINYARHKELENLEIMVGNLNDMNFAEQFDYVVLNGVFEYAMSFTKGDQPYEDFLNFAASFLKPDGIILIAIENRLGLKYFAGAPEDHTDAYMDGLNGYPGNNSVRTFSKGEWLDLMNTCGFKDHKFYYPYPDYKFPCEIFTDETLESQKYGRKAWNFTENRFELFKEQEMAVSFRKEGIMDRFANSFLIEMSRANMKRTKEILYAKMNTDRKEHFAICTVVERRSGEMKVVKQPLNVTAKAHIDHLYKVQETETSHSNYHLLAGNRAEQGIEYPWLSGKSLGYQAELAIQNKQPQKVKELVQKLYEQYLIPQAKEMDYENQNFEQVFGTMKLAADKAKRQCICPANIDLILDNIFPDGERMQVIDGEWIFDFPVPVQFIIWRTINEIYGNCPWLENQLSRASFMQSYDIGKAEEAIFWEWSTHFALHYVGANSLAEYSVPEVGINLAEIRARRMQEQWLDSTLYMDSGTGFSEENSQKVKSKLTEDGKISLIFELPKAENIKALRFDPLEGRPCFCQLTCSEAVLIPANASGKEQEKDLFLTTDPSYQVAYKGSVPDRIKIEGIIEVLDKDWALQKAQQVQVSQKSRFKFWR